MLDTSTVESRILTNFTEEELRFLYIAAMRYDIDDNNDRADLIKAILEPKFQEIGTGTNRIAFMKDGYVFKVAMDRRGLIDNGCELLRSKELPEYTAKIYESNLLINVMEYVTVINRSEFEQNKDMLRLILDDLSRAYIFDDISTLSKNFANWGYRSDGTLVILDYGYLYPREGNEFALKCQKCGAELKYDRSYATLKCTRETCAQVYRVTDIRRKMDKSIEQLELQRLYSEHGILLPDFENFGAIGV